MKQWNIEPEQNFKIFFWKKDDKLLRSLTFINWLKKKPFVGLGEIELSEWKYRFNSE